MEPLPAKGSRMAPETSPGIARYFARATCNVIPEEQPFSHWFVVLTLTTHSRRLCQRLFTVLSLGPHTTGSAWPYHLILHLFRLTATMRTSTAATPRAKAH